MNQHTAKIILLAAMSASLTGATFAKGTPDPIQIDAALDRPVISADTEQSVVVQIKIRPDQIVSDHVRPPVNLCLVLDRSGSMGGEKIRQAIEAAQVAVSRLGPRDIVSVITYSNDATTLAGSQYATEGNIRSIRSALSEVSANGGTAMYAGLNRGASELRRRADEGYINRVILLSDGLANEGPSSVTDFKALARTFANEDIVVSTVGLGSGFNEDVMTTLAEAGQGNTYFVENAVDLPRIFGAELGDALNVAATDIEIIITPKEGVRIKKSLGREAVIENNRASFRLPQVYGGQDKLALLEIEAPIGKDGQTSDLVDVEVRYVLINGSETRSQNVSVPISYAASEEKVQAAAREDVVVNVIDNRIVDAMASSILLSDSGQNVAAANEMKKAKDQIFSDYSYMPEAVSAPAAKLDKTEQELLGGSYTGERRRMIRQEEYQTKNQQSVKE